MFLADGFEDVEAITPIDYLRRAGVLVTVVGVTGISVSSSHHLSVVCDKVIGEIMEKPLPDLIVLPGGGKGSENLAASSDLKVLVKAMFQEKRWVGAICASPAVVLGKWGLLEGRSYTCFPGVGDNLPVKPRTERLVVDSYLITARAAGVAEEFSLQLIESLCGSKTAIEIADAILAR